jgi:hypothetical protein
MTVPGGRAARMARIGHAGSVALVATSIVKHDTASAAVDDDYCNGSVGANVPGTRTRATAYTIASGAVGEGYGAAGTIVGMTTALRSPARMAVLTAVDSSTRRGGCGRTTSSTRAGEA